MIFFGSRFTNEVQSSAQGLSTNLTSIVWSLSEPMIVRVAFKIGASPKLRRGDYIASEMRRTNAFLARLV